jgi:hypothetical protein
MWPVPVLIVVIAVTIALVLLGWALPHHPRIEERTDRLVVWRSTLAGFVSDLRFILSGALAAYLIGVFLLSRQWLLLGVAILVILRMAWVVLRTRHRGRIVVDRQLDRVEVGGTLAGAASSLAAVEIVAQVHAGLVLVFREIGLPDRGTPVPVADRDDAEAIASAIARFARVPIVKQSRSG